MHTMPRTLGHGSSDTVIRQTAVMGRRETPARVLLEPTLFTNRLHQISHRKAKADYGSRVDQNPIHSTSSPQNFATWLRRVHKVGI